MEEGVFIIFAIVLATLLIVGGLLLYVLPAFIAYRRNHPSKEIILILDLLFGWTFLGWAGTLVWAFIDTGDSITINNTQKQNNSNKYDDLEKLQRLKESGAITDIEFEVEKSKILK